MPVHVKLELHERLGVHPFQSRVLRPHARGHRRCPRSGKQDVEARGQEQVCDGIGVPLPAPGHIVPDHRGRAEGEICHGAQQPAFQAQLSDQEVAHQPADRQPAFQEVLAALVAKLAHSRRIAVRAASGANGDCGYVDGSRQCGAFHRVGGWGDAQPRTVAGGAAVGLAREMERNTLVEPAVQARSAVRDARKRARAAPDCLAGMLAYSLMTTRAGARGKFLEFRAEPNWRQVRAARSPPRTAFDAAISPDGCPRGCSPRQSRVRPLAATAAPRQFLADARR